LSTSSQWANAVARDIGRLINGEISQEDFATAMAVATRDWTVSTSDIQELAAQVSSFLMRLQSFIVWDGPPPENIGGLGTWCMNRLTGDIYGPKTAAGWGEPAFSLVGPKGDQGDKGDPGPKGDQGDQGIQGPKGDTGDQGPQGLKGDHGDIGPKGDTGERGIQGETGPKGDTGDTGPKGDKGDQGIQGPKGDKGDRGDAFAVNAQGDLAGRDAYDAEPVGFSYLDVENGNLYFRVAPSGWSTPIPFGKGEKGDKGDPGEEGPQGPKGDPGAPGADGSDATVTEQAVKDALGFTPADAAALETKADLVDGKVPAAQLPAPPTVPTFATVAEVRAGKTAGKIIDPQTMADALAPVVITRTAAAAGMDFDSFINCNIPLDANVTLGPPSGGYPGKSGFLTLSQNATGGWLAALPSQYKLPDGGITQKTTANGKTRIPYVMGGSLEVVLWPTTKWA